jgi:hypothetical protein
MDAKSRRITPLAAVAGASRLLPLARKHNSDPIHSPVAYRDLGARLIEANPFRTV